MLTPQAIKDQEFQSKFRGYDTIEVKAFLEQLADDFFELTEQNRLQAEELESLQAAQDSLRREKDVLAVELKAGLEKSDTAQTEIELESLKLEDEIEELKKALAQAEEQVSAMTESRDELQLKVYELEEIVTQLQSVPARDQAEIEKLRGRVEFLEERNRELKEEGLDFKSTILAAQKFADNLKVEAEQEGEKMMARAKDDVARFRREAETELARLPREIMELKLRKEQVREDLREVLSGYLDGLNVFVEKESEDEENLEALFERIRFPEDESPFPDETDDADAVLDKKS